MVLSRSRDNRLPRATRSRYGRDRDVISSGSISPSPSTSSRSSETRNPDWAIEGDGNAVVAMMARCEPSRGTTLPMQKRGGAHRRTRFGRTSRRRVSLRLAISNASKRRLLRGSTESNCDDVLSGHRDLAASSRLERGRLLGVADSPRINCWMTIPMTSPLLGTTTSMACSPRASMIWHNFLNLRHQIFRCSDDQRVTRLVGLRRSFSVRDPWATQRQFFKPAFLGSSRSGWFRLSASRVLRPSSLRPFAGLVVDSTCVRSANRLGDLGGSRVDEFNDLGETVGLDLGEAAVLVNNF